MYTQCPECQIAFRVTAKVLQQAAGNVRCGSCGHAFNALQYLSEEMPVPAASQSPDEPVHDELAETSRRLLETLDELAGPGDVRIEDTGVEWRVLDEAAADALPPADERRYDDNSPLPDDDDDDSAWSTPAPQRREADLQQPTDAFSERQGDLALSEPEDWMDILEEVSDADAESFAIEEELAAIHTQLSSRDEAAESSDEPDDIDARFSAQVQSFDAEFRGAEDALTDEVPQLDENEFQPSIDDLGDEDSLIEKIEAAADNDSLTDEEDIEDADGDEPVDHEVSQASQSADLEDDEETGTFRLADDHFDDDSETDTGSTGEFGSEDDEASWAASADDEDEWPDEADAETGEALSLDDEDEYRLTDEDHEPDGDDPFEEGLGETAEDDSARDIDDRYGEGVEKSVGAALAEEPDPDISAETTGETEHFVPDPTEEEMTVNTEIDAELMAAAQRDQDFTATLVGLENPEALFNENSGEVETIIMEGEFVRSEIERERLEAEHAARSQLDDPVRLADTYALSREKLRGGRRRYDPPSIGMLAAAAALALLLVGQYIHNSRESLATYGFFNQTIAPVYRVLGSPVTPEWDIKGWQFEATNGSVDAEETTLTIVSRLVNRSDQPLPYPLVHISLTNRFEDIMGSRILEPGEYLAGDGDPSQPVSPGDNFTAVIAIEKVSAEATGFKLNVCYRAEPGTVRCAIEDFKD